LAFILQQATTASSLNLSDLSRFILIRCYEALCNQERVRKGEVFPVHNSLSAAPWRLSGKCM
jgi:hypothetical protein